MKTTTVQEGVIEVSYSIRKQEGEEYAFDWVTDSGEESDEFFPSIESALRDLKSRYS